MEFVTVTLSRSWPKAVWRPLLSYASSVVSPAAVKGALKGALILTSALIAYVLPVIAESPPSTQKWMLFTEICSLHIEHWREKDSAAKDHLSRRIGLLLGQWRIAYPDAKEFNENGGLAFDSCTGALGYGYWEPPADVSKCDAKLPDDHPCLTLEKSACGDKESGRCKLATYRTQFARCGGVTAEAARRECEGRLSP